MARTIAIGIQDFEKLISHHYFYVDKTHFIREWWESGDDVTLITRPRRFGKTLTMSMLERFFSVKYAKDGLFNGLAIWEDEEFRDLQGSYPVINLTFANVKEQNYTSARKKINMILTDLYMHNYFLRDSGLLNAKEIEYFDTISCDMDESTASLALHRLTGYLSRYYGKKAIILLDEYDTPMQEAYVNGYWNELAAFARNLFNASFKSNPFLERAIMTGITRVSKESIFSDLNNLKIITTTSAEYADAFGFTEEEVFSAMDELGYPEKDEVKAWYDGFTFGNIRDIYNPWSILNYLDKHQLGAYWANTSSNSLIGNLIRRGDPDIKQKFECLMRGESIVAPIDEQIVYDQLDISRNAVWSPLLASGYLKVLSIDHTPLLAGDREEEYELTLTNREVRILFTSMIRSWFGGRIEGPYNDFILALLAGDVRLMNIFMNRIALETISFFDSGAHASVSEPERFYHGFVLGLLVELKDRYVITSNRESGYGRYDILLDPQRDEDPAIIIEFKVLDPDSERSLDDTLRAALKQIDDKQYAQPLICKGIPHSRIRKYGFAFQGKTVLIG